MMLQFPLELEPAIANLLASSQLNVTFMLDIIFTVVENKDTKGPYQKLPANS